MAGWAFRDFPPEFSHVAYRLVWAQDLTPRASPPDARGITFFIQKPSSKKYDIPIPLWYPNFVWTMLAASYDDAGSVTFFIQKLAFRKVSHTDSHVTSRSKYQLRYQMRVMKNTLLISLPLVHFLCRNSTHDNANPDKRPPQWQSRTPGLAAWLCYQQPPAPGYLIAMGCLTRHTKDFIQRLKWATKIIHLI